MLPRILLLSGLVAAHAFAPSMVPGIRPASSQTPLLRAQRPSLAQKKVHRAAQAPRMQLGIDAAEEIKSDLLSQLSAGTGLKVAAGGDRVKINELLIQLEPKNPTPEPAESPLLNGVWEMLYTGGYGAGLVDLPTREIALLLYTGGYRPGLITNFLSRLPSSISPLIELDDLQLTIQRDAPRIDASAKFRIFNNEQEIRLRSDLVAESGVRLRETYTTAEGLGQTVDLGGPFKYTRSIFITYLDDDILVARDETGVPDIWIRKAKDFWLDESEKMEINTVPSGPVSNPKINSSAKFEPEWSNEADDDVGPSDY